MARIKRGYERTVIKHRDYHLFAIACEGSVRERDYFAFFEQLSSRVCVDLINDIDEEGNMIVSTMSSPSHVLKRAQDYCINAELVEGDSVWLVVDVDCWNIADLTELCREAHTKKWNVAISNPCFEVWLCYHLVEKINDGGTIFTSSQFKQYLSSLSLGGYDVKKFIRHAFEAAENARKADAHPEYRIPEYKETQVYHLIDELRSCSSEFEIALFIADGMDQ